MTGSTPLVITFVWKRPGVRRGILRSKMIWTLAGLPQKRSTRNPRIARKHWGLRTLCPCAACVYGAWAGRENCSWVTRGGRQRHVAGCGPSKPRAYGRFSIFTVRPDGIVCGVCLQVFGISGPDLPETLGFWAKDRSRVPSFCGTPEDVLDHQGVDVDERGLEDVQVRRRCCARSP